MPTRLCFKNVRPRWEALRAAAGVAERKLPPGLAATGALWLDPVLEAEGQSMGSPPPGTIRAARCWTEVSAVHPADPLLRCAAWSVVWWTGAAWSGRSGLCPWPPTAARAELAAVLWASLAAPGLLEVVADFLSVACGAAAMDAGCGAALLGGPMADLWARYVVVRWVPSHRPAPDPSLGLGAWD